MPKILWNGDPGTTFTNAADKFLYQFIVSWSNSCGTCIQYDHAISYSWPIPLHYNCRCKSIPIKPGGESLPFVDFREKIEELPVSERAKVVGAGNLKLIEGGAVDWSDVVTEGRIRDLREVVSRKKLTVDRMAKLGIDRRTAEEAYRSVNTAHHQIAADTRARLEAALQAKGVARDQIRKAVAERLAARVTIGGGPSGPQGPVVTPGPLPKPLTPKQLAKALGVKIKPVPPPANFKVYGTVSPVLVDEAADFARSLSPRTRKLLDDYGAEIAIGGDMRDVAPEIADDSPRGWPAGLTWANADGAYLPGKKRAFATEYHEEYRSAGKRAKSTRTIGVLRHETGHAIDHAAGKASQGAEFLAAYREDIGKIDDDTVLLQNLGYYLQGGDAGPSEAFAEGFGFLMGGGASRDAMDRYFPATLEFIRSRYL